MRRNVIWQRFSSFLKNQWIKISKKNVAEALEQKKRDIKANFQQTTLKYKYLKIGSEIEAEYKKKFKDLMLMEKTSKQYDKLTISLFGAHKEYFPLLGQCFKLRSNEKVFKTGSFSPVAGDFEFELCPFLAATQKRVMPSGDLEELTVLGMWEKWDKKHEQTNWLYSNGDECWQGPSRKLKVFVICDTISELKEVKEDGKCNYEMVFSTPAACSIEYGETLVKHLNYIAEEPTTEHLHDEL